MMSLWRIFSVVAVLAYGIRDDDSAKSLAAMESIMESARANADTSKQPSHDDEMAAFLDEMKSAGRPSLGGACEGFSSQCAGVNNALEKAYQSFHSAFPHHLYGEFVENFESGLAKYTESSAFNGYATIEGQTRCPVGMLSNETLSMIASRHVSPYPGGVAVPVSGMDVVGKAMNQLSAANGPAAAQVPGIGLLAQAALQQVKGVLQTVVATAVTDIPPSIPAPVWNNQPFPCMPMVTGHNCAGAVLYPITIGDFVMADMTDAALDGVVANFPSYYRQHIGHTDDATYQRCFSSYMSMQCANSFPMCTTVQARQNDVPFLGRGPMCFLHCVQTLIACPGMWVDDLEDICQHVSVPPVCSFASYAKAAPAQLTTYDESQGAALNCPSSGNAGAAAGVSF